jgi:hypothetical protein
MNTRYLTWWDLTIKHSIKNTQNSTKERNTEKNIYIENTYTQAWNMQIQMNCQIF